MFWDGAGISSEVIRFLVVFCEPLNATRSFFLLSSILFLGAYSLYVSNIQAIHSIGSWVYDHASVYR